MASIISDPNGRRRIQFAAGDGTRKTLRLGKATMRQAEAVKVKVEQLALAASGVTGVVDPDTAQWLAGLDDVMYDRLAAVGLVAERGCAKLGAFLDSYIADRCDVKPATALVYGHTRRNLIDYFGAGKPLAEITPGEADKWRLYLIGLKLSDNTVRRRCGIAKQFFRAAVRRKLLVVNPFADLKAAIQANAKRFYFISKEEAAKVLDACPDAQWRLLFALSRYGGLRCPSEHLSLRWGDVDWENGRILIRSPKTEHHAGGESRMLPLFPELLPHLREVFEEAEPGTEYVITRYRARNCNLRTQLERIIKRAGLQPWPKLFQNLRSTRETELAERWPVHVVCAWIGNSRAVAQKHYLQVTDDHFAQAATERTPNPTQNPTQRPDSPLKATQNPTQQAAELAREEPQPIGQTALFGQKRGSAGQCEGEMGDTGFEPVTSCVSCMRSNQLS